MGRRLKEPVIRECERCGEKFMTDSSTRRFCSTKCSFFRMMTPERKRQNSIARTKFLLGDTDEAEEARLRIRKNLKVPPDIPHPDKRVLEKNEFVAGDELWEIDGRGIDWERYYGWK